jgi:hypothetical protein
MGVLFLKCPVTGTRPLVLLRKNLIAAYDVPLLLDQISKPSKQNRPLE